MSRTVRTAAAIVAAQAALIGLYWLVEHERSAGDGAPAPLGTAPPQEVRGRAPPLSLTRADGSRFELRAGDQPMLVHFWATWCPPCRDELPSLLTLPQRRPVEVLAIALDDDWADVEAFLDGERDSRIVLGDATTVEQALGVRSLPVTFLMEPDARLRLRFDGARDWTDPRFLASWLEEAEHD